MALPNENQGAPASPLASQVPSPPWLAVVGIGEDGVDGLSPAARRAVADAAVVFGGRRHLELAASLIKGAAEPWPTPFDASMAAVRARAGEAVCVLASGDPMLFGVGVTLARVIPPGQMRVYPAPSAFSLAAARLGWALQDVAQISLLTRPATAVRASLQPGRRILVLTADGAQPAAVAAVLAADGYGDARLHVLEAMGGPREQIHALRADTVGDQRFHDLNVVAIEVPAAAEHQGAPLGVGMPDDLFAHDGQFTRREMRAITLSSLRPRPGQTLWDLGAGSGSISIEWLRQHPAMRAIAVERDAVRAARIADNAAAFGVAHQRIIHGAAPQALEGLPTPDAIFIGGGARAEVLDAAINALRPGGRLVVNGVTLETQTLLMESHARLGGELLQIALGRADAVGALRGWRPAMPIVQWAWEKPLHAAEAAP